MKHALTLAALLTAALLPPAPAEAADALKGKTFHFGTHPARTNVTFVSEADIETIHGVTNAMEGSIAVAADGRSATGNLTVPVDALRTGISLRDEHLRSADWLDEKRYPEIRLALVTAREDKKDPRRWDITADLTIKGKTKRITVEAKVVAIPDRFSKSLGGGSWVRVRTDFDVKLADHGIVVPERLGAKVSGTWRIGIDIYGTTKAPEKAPKKAR